MGLVSGWASEGARARLGRWLLAATILVSALGLGALHTPVLALVAVLAATAAALLWYDAEPIEPRPAATALVLVGLLLVVWTGAQLIPLPRGLVAAIASESADVWARSLSPLREDGPSFVTLSLEPVATRVQLLRGVTYLAVFIGALRVARRQEGVAFLERALLVSTVALAGAALLHPALGARKVFGVYEPGEAIAYDVHRLAPLLNTNHLAAYVNIGSFLALGCVIERREALPRPPALVIVLLLGAVTVWTLSRGGAASLVVGALIVTAMTLRARRRRRERVAGPAAVVVVAIVGYAIASLAAFDDARAKLAYNDLSKIGLIKSAFELVRGHPIFGVGRGAFEATFPRVRQGTGYWVYTHPENVIAQWMTEWGVPVALLALVAIAWALRPRTALARSRPPSGAWAALVAVALHNLVDFSSEVPGVVVALAVCAAMVTGGTGGGSPEPRRGGVWARRPDAVAVGLGGATVLAVLGAAPFSANELYNEQRSIKDEALDPELSREAFHRRVREAMLRHPADPYFPYVGAVRATVARDESVLPWAARALERSPVYGRAHLLLARTLFVKNPSQARLEYRLACAQDSKLCGRDESLRLVGGFDDAMELVPSGEGGLVALSHLAQHLGERLPATVARIDREIVARDPRALGPAQRTAARALGDIKAGEVWCDDPSGATPSARRSCVADGLEAAARLRAAAPERCEGHALIAELRIAAGEAHDGYAELERALEQVTERSACARRLVSLAVQIGDSARIDAAVDRLLKLGCEAPAECVKNLEHAASVEASRGRQRRALALIKLAWERAPERDDLLMRVATKAEAQGLHGEALEAYMKLAERRPGEPKWAEAAARTRERATRSVLERR